MTDAGHINVKVVGQDQAEIYFKIDRTVQLQKLMDSYCERQGKSRSSVRFLFDGTRVQPTNTATQLDIQEGDTIDVMAE
ncbi:small ubiquitin-related modifier [Streptomyces sp. NPDC058289]|uniref:small ubiquitin-related modifier n=1 Tax=Streptomyces sp. NPDC058289 TaxID=3346425 RepID=UPI0036ED5E94